MSALSTQRLQFSLSDTGAATADAPDGWRWRARELLTDLRDALVTDSPPPSDGWLAPRRAGMIRERDALLARLGTLGSHVMQESTLGAIRSELNRLVVDVERHLQRRRDLAWDEVELELGGSD